MISIQRLTKQYRRRTTVDNVTFDCPAGTVTGFLGPNGAGKSTTLRMLCGLARPTSGVATVAGRPYGDLASPGRQVGVFLDTRSQHNGRTGRETLSLAAMVLRIRKERVGRTLDIVGLDETAARTRVGRYSMGMRQRLGIAAALLGEPEVLVLDEPANSLDPEGIFWLRELVRGFAHQGGTVLLSSHLLHEVEAMADQIVVLHHGRVIVQGPLHDLIGAPSHQGGAAGGGLEGLYRDLTRDLGVAGSPHGTSGGGR